MNALSYLTQRNKVVRSVGRFSFPGRMVSQEAITFERLEELLLFLGSKVHLNLIEDHGYRSPRGHHSQRERYTQLSLLDADNMLFLAEHWAPGNTQTFHAVHSAYEVRSLGFLELSDTSFPLFEHHYIDFEVHNPNRSTAFGKDVSHYPQGTIDFRVMKGSQCMEKCS